MKPKKIKTQCHICRLETKSEVAPEYCPRCGSNLADPTLETLQKATMSRYWKSSTKWWDGRLYLTNHRLIWVKDNANGWAYGGGLVGWAIATGVSEATGGGKVGLSLALQDIEAVGSDKMGFAKAITIRTRAEGDIGKLSISKKEEEEWLNAIRQGMMGAL